MNIPIKYFKKSQNYLFGQWMEPKEILRLRTRVDLVVYAMKGIPHFPELQTWNLITKSSFMNYSGQSFFVRVLLHYRMIQ